VIRRIPTDRVVPDRIARYLGEAKQLLPPRTTRRVLLELRQMMRAMVPEKNLAWIARHSDRPSGSAVRDSRRPPKIFDPKEVCNKAMDLMDHIKAGPPTFEMRIWYRDALIVAIQWLCAFRRRNLAEMVLGRNLIIDGDVIHLIFSPD
jgi:hypothetical protein